MLTEVKNRCTVKTVSQIEPKTNIGLERVTRQNAISTNNILLMVNQILSIMYTIIEMKHNNHPQRVPFIECFSVYSQYEIITSAKKI